MMVTGKIREGLARRIDGTRDPPSKTAYVRYTGFAAGHKAEDNVVVLDGSYYNFRHKRPTDHSQWIAIHKDAHIETFRQADDYEIKYE